MKAGRNSPCPCGSGKKYKRCCGSANGEKAQLERDLDAFELAGRIAYVGRIGRERQNFCETYSRIKNAQFQKIKAFQDRYAAGSNEVIRCRKGCCYCCAHFVGGSLQECELIVFYLYQNEQSLALFIRTYPEWRLQVGKNEQLFQRLSRSFNRMVTSGFDDRVARDHSEYSAQYLKQNIYCPFLYEKACIIYPVRPKSCAALFATGDPEWCNPLNENMPEQFTAACGQLEPPFYYGSKAVLFLSNVPLMVYEILKGGFIYLARMPDLKNIDKEVFSDSESQAILSRFQHLIH